MERIIYAEKKWELLATLAKLVDDAEHKDGDIDTLVADFEQLIDDYKGGKINGND